MISKLGFEIPRFLPINFVQSWFNLLKVLSMRDFTLGGQLIVFVDKVIFFVMIKIGIHILKPNLGEGIPGQKTPRTLLVQFYLGFYPKTIMR